MASNSAKPGEDNDFVVPLTLTVTTFTCRLFTVARRDVQGLLAFLKTYFDANSEASVGCFTSADAEMKAVDDGKNYEVNAKTWLAPFDLGISQQFTLLAHETELKAIFGIKLKMELLSGQRSAWKRVTLPFEKNCGSNSLSAHSMKTRWIATVPKAGMRRIARVAELNDHEEIERKQQESKMATSHAKDEEPDEEESSMRTVQMIQTRRAK